MKSIWMRLSSLGCDEQNYPAYINNKISLTNQITFCLLLASSGYSLFAYVYYPDILFVPLSGSMISLLVFAFHYAGMVYLSRVMISITPIIVAGAFNAYITPAGESPLTGLYLMELTFALIPFLLIDARERSLLIISALVCFTVFISFDFSNTLLEKDLDERLLREGFYGQATIVFSLLLAFAYIYILVHLTYSSEQKAETLLSRMEEHNQAMQEAGQQLQMSMESLALASEEEKKREWISNGLNGLSVLIRTESDTNKLAVAITKYIVKYLSANQAGFYLVKRSEEETYIELTAAYAYDRQKYGKKRIEIREGLLGQAYVEAEMVFLTDIPQNYLSITSGLGLANPTCIVIMPLVSNSKVEGLIEIASFEVLKGEMQEFLKQAGVLIASVLSQVVTNETTRQLLKESQLLTEQIRSSEEELRQNMEELSATQEEMLRKEKSYLLRIEELETKLMISGKELK